MKGLLAATTALILQFDGVLSDGVDKWVDVHQPVLDKYRALATVDLVNSVLEGFSFPVSDGGFINGECFDFEIGALDLQVSSVSSNNGVETVVMTMIASDIAFTCNVGIELSSTETLFQVPLVVSSEDFGTVIPTNFAVLSSIDCEERPEDIVQIKLSGLGGILNGLLELLTPQACTSLVDGLGGAFASINEIDFPEEILTRIPQPEDIVDYALELQEEALATIDEAFEYFNEEKLNLFVADLQQKIILSPMGESVREALAQLSLDLENSDFEGAVATVEALMTTLLEQDFKIPTGIIDVATNNEDINKVTVALLELLTGKISAAESLVVLVEVFSGEVISVEFADSIISALVEAIKNGFPDSGVGGASVTFGDIVGLLPSDSPLAQIILDLFGADTPLDQIAQVAVEITVQQVLDTGLVEAGSDLEAFLSIFTPETTLAEVFGSLMQVAFGDIDEDLVNQFTLITVGELKALISAEDSLILALFEQIPDEALVSDAITGVAAVLTIGDFLPLVDAESALAKLLGFLPQDLLLINCFLDPAGVLFETLLDFLGEFTIAEVLPSIPEDTIFFELLSQFDPESSLLDALETLSNTVTVQEFITLAELDEDSYIAKYLLQYGADTLFSATILDFFSYEDKTEAFIQITRKMLNVITVEEFLATFPEENEFTEFLATFGLETTLNEAMTIFLEQTTVGELKSHFDPESQVAVVLSFFDSDVIMGEIPGLLLEVVAFFIVENTFVIDFDAPLPALLISALEYIASTQPDFADLAAAIIADGTLAPVIDSLQLEFPLEGFGVMDFAVDSITVNGGLLVDGVTTLNEGTVIFPYLGVDPFSVALTAVVSMTDLEGAVKFTEEVTFSIDLATSAMLFGVIAVDYETLSLMDFSTATSLPSFFTAATTNAECYGTPSVAAGLTGLLTRSSAESELFSATQGFDGFAADLIEQLFTWYSPAFSALIEHAQAMVEPLFGELLHMEKPDQESCTFNVVDPGTDDPNGSGNSPLDLPIIVGVAVAAVVLLGLVVYVVVIKSKPPKAVVQNGQADEAQLKQKEIELKGGADGKEVSV